MKIRVVLWLVLFAMTTLYAAEYPKLFETLGTPLYKAAQSLEYFSSQEKLKEPIKSYRAHTKELLVMADEISKSGEKRAKLSYLKSLRKLQKEYDYIIHLVHREIDKAIKEDDYSSFKRLTAYELPTLLSPKSLRLEAVKYYQKHISKGQIKLLEEIIEEKRLITSSVQAMHPHVESAHLNSNTEEKRSDKKFYASTKKGRGFVEVFFTNKNIYDVTVQVMPKYKNTKVIKLKDNIFVVPARSQVAYAKFYYTHNRGTQYALSYRWILGSKDAKHERGYLYRLPYARGKAHMVAQGFNGKQTHKGASRYAIDFQMNIGTKIYAARDGIVIQTKDDSNKHGFAKKFAKYGNHITILHNDGTFATYYHLKKGGVMVHVGQKVFRGNPIGYSGNTGYSSGPHLHFEVFHATSDLKIQSIPIRFISASSVVDNPQVRKFYRAK